MDEKIAKIISGLVNWGELAEFEKNARDRNQFDAEIAEALRKRASILGRKLVELKTGLSLTDLSPAQEKIVEAVAAYVAIQKQRGVPVERTFLQLKNRGFIGAAEISVCKAQPTVGFQHLAEANKDDLSYEQIVVDYPEEFSVRAQWYARRALGLTNLTSKPPADQAKETQTRTVELLKWLADGREADGRLAEFTNGDAAAAIGVADLQVHGRAQGNVQSRLDYACFLCGLPPIGLAAVKPFGEAWGQQQRDWGFPVEGMSKCAKLREWGDGDFERLLKEAEKLPGQGHALWKDALAMREVEVKSWAFAMSAAGNELESHRPSGGQSSETLRNPRWSRDELILALDLYMRYRSKPLSKDAVEIVELSQLLGKIAIAFGVIGAVGYRNANGVYMKLMNFRRFDPQVLEGGRVGLTRGNKDEEPVWNEFAGDEVRLRAVAAAIRAVVDMPGVDEAALAGIDEPDLEEAPEGRVLTRLHRFRERNRELANAKKKQVLAKCGRLECEACAFVFADRYGESAADIIDCHHMKPIHTLGEGAITRLEDLALLCSNCHRVIHASQPWLTLEQLRDMLQGQGGSA
jgi:predicted HNH restriction endonuclease